MQVQLNPSAHVIPTASFCVLLSGCCTSSVAWEACMAWSQLRSATVFEVPVADCSALSCLYCSGCLRKVIVSLDCFREEHLPDPPTHSANTALYTQDHPLLSLASRWVQLSSQLLWTPQILFRVLCGTVPISSEYFFCCRALLISLLFQVEKFWEGVFLSVVFSTLKIAKQWMLKHQSDIKAWY